ncbi:MAG: Na/Pi cotransporter family protein [Candidatus Omnitrophota bacterium]
MNTKIIFLLIGGVGFFFFGMRTMSEGLKKVAGERLKSILNMVTKVPLVGVLVGAAVTCIIQSSGATSVMVVGFVNAGLLTLKQAISVVIGANIGTTMTAWLVSFMALFKITQYALPCVGIGFVMSTFGKTKRIKSWGEVILGFGILFIGLSYMKEAFEPLKDSQRAKDIFVMFSTNPLLGILVGIIFTFLLHSSSATIAITQVLAYNGLISFSSTIPLILGDNIGSTTTAQLAAIGTNLTARRTAMAHTVFNVIGVTYMLFFVYTGWFAKAVEFVIPGGITQKNIMFHIAVAHSMFNVVNTAIFLPLIGWLEKVAIWLVPKRKGAIELGPQYLEKHLLDTPPLAMQQARNEVRYMLSVAAKSVTHAIECFMNNDEKDLDKVAQYERITDNLQSEITQYVIELSQRELASEESQEIPVLIHNVNDIERVGDHSTNIAELAEAKIDEKIVFSPEAIKELNMMSHELQEMLKETEEALKQNDPMIAQNILKREERINEYQIRFKESHIDRLNHGVCVLSSNFTFLDFIDNLEKIADHLTNIAQGVIGRMRWTMHRHENT